MATAKVLSIGVTGSRRGMTPVQFTRVQLILEDLYTKSRRKVAHFHHGDCVGADEQAARIAKKIGYRIIGHPPIQTTYQANFSSDENHPRKQYVVRDRDIVTEVDTLLVCPHQMHPVIRSGTWTTWRIAKRTNKHYIIIYPDATVEDSRGSKKEI